MAGSRRPISILHAPTPLGLKPPAAGGIPGAWRMPAALMEAGFHEMLAARFAGEVTPVEYDPRPDSSLNILNAHGIREHATRLAQRILQLLNERTMPLVLGGDCSVLIGCALALRRAGRCGLVFVDGHADVHTPTTSSTGGVAGMDLAIVTGTGPRLLTDIDGLRPYVRPTDAVQVGCRDADAQVDSSGVLVESGIRAFVLSELRARGVQAVVECVLTYFERAGVKRFWIHVDADVLHDDIMPAVDSRQPGGVTPSELARLLRGLHRSGRVTGMDVTIYDPELDPAGVAGLPFARTLAAGILLTDGHRVREEVRGKR